MAENPHRKVLEAAIIEAAVAGKLFSFEAWAEAQSIADADRSVAKSVGADFLRDLCLEVLPADAWPGHRRLHPKGIKLEGLAIAGTLDFEDRAIERPLWISNCVFDEGCGVILRDTRGKSCGIQDCELWLLNAQGARIDGSVFLRGTRCHGEVTFADAHIDGQLDCSGATCEGEDCGLAADGLEVKGGVLLTEGFTANGKEAVRLMGAHISGELNCSGAKFEGQDCGLTGDGLEVKGDVFLDEGFTANGKEAVRLPGAHIGGHLDCRGATFDGKEQGFTADGLEVKGDVFLDRALRATGDPALSLNNAKITGSLWLNLSLVKAEPEGSAIALDRAEIGDRLHIAPLDPSTTGWIGRVDLRNASVDVLSDDPAAWPQTNCGEIRLDGFRYRHLLDPHRVFRIAWLGRQPDDHLNGEFRPQPWEQLAKVYRESGHPEEARAVLIAKQNHFGPVIGKRALSAFGIWWREEQKPQWRQSRETWRAFRAYLWHEFLGWTVGYGYEPLRAFAYVLAIWLLGAFFFWCADSHGLMAPTQAAANVYLAKEHKMLPGYPEFQPLWYSLDVSLPVVDLHQESFWEPSAPACEAAAGMAGYVGRCAGPRTADARWLLEVWRVFQILSGWVLVALAVAGLTGIVKKD